MARRKEPTLFIQTQFSLSDINVTSIFLTEFKKNMYSSIKLNRNLSRENGFAPMLTGGQTETDIMKLIAAFYNFAMASNT
jgi:hypothetical protein